jgi:hypothetical protein
MAFGRIVDLQSRATENFGNGRGARPAGRIRQKVTTKPTIFAEPSAESALCAVHESQSVFIVEDRRSRRQPNATARHSLRNGRRDP